MKYATIGLLLLLMACTVSPAYASTLPSAPNTTLYCVDQNQNGSIDMDEVFVIIDAYFDNETIGQPPVQPPQPATSDMEERLAALELRVQELEQQAASPAATSETVITVESEAAWRARLIEAGYPPPYFGVSPWIASSIGMYPRNWYGVLAPTVSMESPAVWRERMDERVTAIEWSLLGYTSDGTRRPIWDWRFANIARQR